MQKLILSPELVILKGGKGLAQTMLIFKITFVVIMMLCVDCECIFHRLCFLYASPLGGAIE